MSDLLAIVGPAEADDELLGEIASCHPHRVTVLVQDADPSWAEDSAEALALRDRLAILLASIERGTGALVIGLVGDRAQLVGWRFDRVVGDRAPVAA